MALSSPVGSIVDPKVKCHAINRIYPYPGTWVLLESLGLQHYDDLWESIGGPEHDDLWTYLPMGPYANQKNFDQFLSALAEDKDQYIYVYVDQSTKKALGMLYLMNMDCKNRTVEIGNIILSPSLQRSTLVTEAFWMISRILFESLHFRRLEWKCDIMNDSAVIAAQRLGFKFEGTLYQHMIVKGRNRDTASFRMLDHEWDLIRQGLQFWLKPSNFDEHGMQIQRLAWFHMSVQSGQLREPLTLSLSFA